MCYCHGIIHERLHIITLNGCSSLIIKAKCSSPDGTHQFSHNGTDACFVYTRFKLLPCGGSAWSLFPTFLSALHDSYGQSKCSSYLYMKIQPATSSCSYKNLSHNQPHISKRPVVLIHLRREKPNFFISKSVGVLFQPLIKSVHTSSRLPPSSFLLSLYL